mgnify:CR=1 FL=1|jgi:branched-chain amino acid transport protein azlD
MNESTLHALFLILIMAGGTALLRFLPFILFPSGRKTPKIVTYLGNVLPFAMIGMLVIYCLKDISVLSGTHGLPELLAIIIVIGLHVWRRNTLLSVGVGTVCYMIFIQFLF